MKRSYHGSCHCGAVRFKCDLDLSAGTSRCNCSFCAKARFWKAIVAADAFRIVQGEDALTDYQFGRRTIHHLFCSRCGITPFGSVHIEGLGELRAVNVACLDDASDEELASAPVRYENGRQDDRDSPPAETRHL
jgi:hypothetical protein